MGNRKIGLPTNSGIYCFENKENGKKYIGKSINISKRVSTHISNLCKNKDGCEILQNAWNKYGEEAFLIYVIEECPEEVISDREIFYIDKLKTKTPLGYNMTDGGEGLSGYKQSEETKEKRRIKWSGEKNPNFGKFGKDNHRFGTKLSSETRNKISKSLTGNKPSEETREKQSLAHIGKNIGEKNYFYGKNHSATNNGNFGRKGKNSSSKYYGVYINKQKGYVYWISHMSVNGKMIHIGTYKTEVEAAKAYDNYVNENNLPNPLNFPEK